MNFRDHLNQFFQGRYGNDALNRFLLVMFFIFTLLYLFTGIYWVDLLSLLLVILIFFRMLSRNYTKRSAENQKFLNITEPIRTTFHNLFSKEGRSSAYKVFVCPTCRQKLRVPKGKGKVQITCPKCHCDFIKRS